jgi:hypothetical protein
MKLVKLTLAMAALTLAAAPAIAQKVKLKEGKLDALKGTTEFNVRYDYSGMTVTTKNKPEAEFIETKKKEYNDKEPGKGDTWATSWVADRDKRYAVQFKEEFEKQSDLKIAENPNAKYTLVFRTTHTETGYNIGISRRDAYIDGEALIVETANPDNVIAKIAVDDCPGRTFGGYDFDTGVRLQEAYAMAGKAVGKFIGKKIK